MWQKYLDKSVGRLVKPRRIVNPPLTQSKIRADCQSAAGCHPALLTAVILLVVAAGLRADTGHAAWLAYKPLQVPENLPAVVVLVGNSPIEATARDELILGIRDIFGRTERSEQRLPSESSIVLGTAAEIRPLFPDIPPLGDEAFCLKADGPNIVIAGGDARGVLYGTFAFLRRLASHQP